jgi:hypothetical protein
MSVRGLVLALPLVVSAVGSSSQAADRSVRLKMAMLPSPEATLSMSDVIPMDTSPVRLSDQGLVIPKNFIMLYKPPSRTVTIAGTSCTLRRENGTFVFEVAGAGSVKLTKQGSGYRSVPLTLADRRTYVVAFPVATQYAIGYRSGTVGMGKVDGKDLTIYDDNTDGSYTVGDTFQIGRSLVFAPISGHFATSSSVYKLVDMADDGSQVTYSPYSGETGKLSLKCGAAAFEAHATFGSKEADLNLVLTSRGSSAKVIPGTYGMLYGLAYGAAKRKAYAGIVPGSLPAAQVAGGGEATVVIGGPFRLEFTHAVQGDKLIVDPSDIKLKGKGDEEYVSFRWQGVPKVNIVAGGRTVSSGSMAYG